MSLPGSAMSIQFDNGVLFPRIRFFFLIPALMVVRVCSKTNTYCNRSRRACMDGDRIQSYVPRFCARMIKDTGNSDLKGNILATSSCPFNCTSGSEVINFDSYGAGYWHSSTRIRWLYSIWVDFLTQRGLLLPGVKFCFPALLAYHRSWDQFRERNRDKWSIKREERKRHWLKDPIP